jgi:two-component system chemotaxis sensor kinase CheA
MNPLLEQFLSESREFSEGIGKKLMELEDAPRDQDVINELFRLVHTLKGNSGLFTFPEMTRVLHAGEDLLGLVRTGQIAYSRNLADRLLDAMDFVSSLCEDIEENGRISSRHAEGSGRIAATLRALMPAAAAAAGEHGAVAVLAPAEQDAPMQVAVPPLAEIPEADRMASFRLCHSGDPLHWIGFVPEKECFFQGEDPFHRARNIPGLLWGSVRTSEPLPPLAELDTYCCVLEFSALAAAPREELTEYFRYMPEQANIVRIDPMWLVIPERGVPEPGVKGSARQREFPVHFTAQVLADIDGGNLDGVRRAAVELLETMDAASWQASVARWLLVLLECIPDQRAALHLLIESFDGKNPPDWTVADRDEKSGSQGSRTKVDSRAEGAPMSAEAWGLAQQNEVAALKSILAAQQKILMLEDHPAWEHGRMRAVATVLTNLSKAVGDAEAASLIEAALSQSLTARKSAALLQWLQEHMEGLASSLQHARPMTPGIESVPNDDRKPEPLQSAPAKPAGDDGVKFGRRAEDAQNGPRSLKVDQSKIDLLMNLIGELVVEKNALPYLAQRAETQYGVRELSREIKSQYSVINRIADEMQDAIMQVRMMAVSIVFQRFPRMVRDISRKLDKEVQLVLEGEQTEADKNIIESLADPLIHIVRNSLDHGLETPDVRRALGKPEMGTLTISAAQQADRVVIEITDDGKGIDPAVIKRKAYEKGLIDEAGLERLSDQEAINLIFAAGLSTAEVISDLSGRGVGMDVVRSAVEKINGTVVVSSELGKGTKLSISLPLSMAVTQVMIVESDRQLFGVPMDHVVETVRVPKTAIRFIKQSMTAILRGRVVPLKAINGLLGISAHPRTNDDDELAILLVQVGGGVLGLLVDGFRETIGVIQKPLGGFLSGLSAYSGSALMGDGSVLMILNIRELL